MKFDPRIGDNRKRDFLRLAPALKLAVNLSPPRLQRRRDILLPLGFVRIIDVHSSHCQLDREISPWRADIEQFLPSRREIDRVQEAVALAIGSAFQS